MKVLVGGSYNHYDESKKNKTESFEMACEVIGRGLVDEGHTIVICPSEEESGDLSIVKGGVKSEKKPKIILFENDKKSCPEIWHLEKMDKIDLIYNEYDLLQPEPVAIVKSIDRADILLLIGGTCQTLIKDKISRLLEKPVLPIQGFDGTADDIWKESKDDFGKALDRESFDILNNPWSDDSLSALLKAIEQIKEFIPFRSRTGISPAVITLFSVLALLSIWLGIFMGQIEIPIKDKTLSTFLMLPISVLLGSILRIMPGLYGDSQFLISLRQLIIDTSKSLILAFCLLIVYLYVGFITTEQVPMLNSHSAKINLSILGVFTGILMERSEVLVKERIQNVFQSFWKSG